MFALLLQMEPTSPLVRKITEKPKENDWESWSCQNTKTIVNFGVSTLTCDMSHVRVDTPELTMVLLILPVTNIQVSLALE